MLEETRIKQTAKEQEEYVIRMRRYFHEHPENSMEEKETYRVIAGELDQLGIPYETVGDYGIIGRLETGRPGKTLLLRSDMDALPTQESETNLKGKKVCVSGTPGVGHLCGHDGHMAVLLGAIRALNEMKEELCGTVLFCFEQGEEGGWSIDAMLEALSRYHIDYAWGIHLYADLDCGKVSVQPGPRMASVAAFAVKVKGVGGHGSRPDLCVDPGACIVQILAQVPSLLKARIAPDRMVTFSVGNIQVGSKPNVIAEEGFFSGSLRFYDYGAGCQAMDILCRVTEGLAAVHGCTVEYQRKLVCDTATINDPAMAAVAARAAAKAVGEENVAETEPWMATETFGRYLQRYPGVFAFVGIRNEELGAGAGHHNPQFDLDERALEKAVECTLFYAAELLKETDGTADAVAVK